MRIENKAFAMTLETERQQLSFEGNVHTDRIACKTAGEMKELLYETDMDETEKLYDFFVGTADGAHREAIAGSGLRYDLILVRAGTVGDEYKKTSGHVHEGLYPEIYEVLYGTALFLLQKGSGRDISRFAAVRAVAGEKILIPPGYTHATVNIGDGPLLFSDLVADQCQNHYEDVRENHGMCFYVLQRDGKMVFEKNPNYHSVPEARVIRPVEKPELGIEFQAPVYDRVSEAPGIYEYLVHPERYREAIGYLAKVIEETGEHMKYYFSPSLMCMDLRQLEYQTRVMNERADFYHVDIMDGHFVKNITLSPMFVQQIKEIATLPIDVHLMVENPNDFIEVLAEAGAGYISPHAETINKDAFRTINRIKACGCKVGIVLNPATPLSYISPYMDLLDKLTILTVDAGFAGQKFIDGMLDKIKEAKRLRKENGYHYLIEVDGSCNEGTFQKLAEAGTEVFIVGTSGLFKLDPDLPKAWDKMMEIFHRCVPETCV